jgi:SAM-dependent methyltransferase
MSLPATEAAAGRPASAAPAGSAAAVDKTAGTIREMFAGVAPRYDLLNRVLSARRDVAWRRQAALALGLAPGSAVLDLCCGTGDQALAAGRLGYQVAAADFCLPMLALARRKYLRRPAAAAPTGLAGDSLRLPFAAAAFDGVTVYHVQIANGDVTRILQDNIDAVCHIHTAGVPSREEIDDTNELNYRFIANVIADLGYTGYVAHEHRPADGRDPIESLQTCFDILNV